MDEKKVFEDKDTAAAFATGRLAEKYGAKFAINEQFGASHSAYGSRYVYLFAATCVEGEDAGGGCVVWVTDYDEEMDDFAANFVRREAEKAFEEKLQDFPGLVSFKAEFFGVRTNVTFPRDVALSEYLELCKDAQVACAVELNGDLEAETQAEQIHTLIEKLLPIGVPFKLNVNANGVTIFLYNFTEGRSHWTVDELTNQIKTYIDHYERHAVL